MSEQSAPLRRSWRILAARGDAKIDLEGTGTVDELFIDDWFHLEQMEDDVWWMRIGDACVVVSAPEGKVPEVQITRGEYESGVVELENDKGTETAG